MGRPERTGLYLWVLEQNAGARAFYEARGGRCVGRDLVSPPGGLPAGSGSRRKAAICLAAADSRLACKSGFRRFGACVVLRHLRVRNRHDS